MKTLAAYIPMDRRQALARGEDLPDQTEGSALFADISGFTPLAEALAAQLGPQRGAEELTHQLNRVYEALIAQVHSYGGSVIGFVGDAITCWFDADDGLRATACALSMQRVMASFAQVEVTAGVTASLTIKVGIATGPVRRFRVGDPQIQYIDVLAGDTLRRMSLAEGLAHKGQGEVLLDAAAAANVGDDVTVREWRTPPGTDERPSTGLRTDFAVVAELVRSVTPAPWPDLVLSEAEGLPSDALTKVQVRPWVLPPVYQRLKAGQSHFLAELRPAVSLFLRFAGLDYDHDKAAGDKLDAYIRWVQHVVDRYDGSLIQLTIGDKGSFLYAAFGAPIAHDDDPLRACLAALELRTPPPELDFIISTQIGLARGQMRSGPYGSTTRRSYGVIGDDTVLACRLMEAAPPDEIRCDHNVYRQTEAHIAFEGLPPVRVKGKAGLVRVYRPVGRRSRGAEEWEDEQAIVGRQAEVARLKGALDAIEAGESRVLVIEGEAGIGKSRLVAELARLVRERGLTGLLGSGQSIEQQTPYRAWRDVFTSYFGLDEVTDPTARRERVQRAAQELVPDHVQRLPLLNDVLNLGLPETDLTSGLDPELRQQSLVSLLLTLLQAWTRERPLILVLEDAHWLDSLSWELALQVARALALPRSPLLAVGKAEGPGGRLLLVLVTRPLDVHSAGARHLESLSRTAGAEAIPLIALRPEETITLVSARLGLPEGGLPDPVADLVRERAGGNPFFAEELILTLRDQEIITVVLPAGGEEFPQEQGGRCVVSGDLAQASQTLPQTVQGLVLARMDRLPPEQQSTLKAASVVGRTFAHATLSHILQQHTAIADDALKSHLDVLDRLDLTTLDTIEPLTYIFKHIITQEVAYQTLLFSQRRQMHRAVARWYETTFEGERLAPYYPLLVHHYRHAEDAERERHCARLAGERAAAQFANAEAVEYLGRALDLTPETDHTARFALLLARERVYDLQGERQVQKEDLATLEKLAKALADDRRQAEVAYLWGQYHDAVGDYPQAQAAVEQALVASRERNDIVSEVRCLDRLGFISWRQGQYDEAKAWYHQALALLQDKDTYSDEESQALAQVLNGLGTVHRQQGQFDEAGTCYERALTLNRMNGDRMGEARALNNLGVTAFYRRHFDQALAHHQRALKIRRAIGDRAGEGTSLFNLALVALDTGDYSQAQECFSDALVIQQAIGNRYEEVNVCNSLGIMYHELGDLSAARICLQRGLVLAQEIGDEAGQAYVLGSLGVVVRDLGDLVTAEELLTQGLDLAQVQADKYLVSLFLCHLGIVSLQAGRIDQAVERANKALAMRRDLDLRLWTTSDLVTLAAAYLASSATGQALDCARQALTILEECGGEGPDFPHRDYFVCYQVLSATGQEKAARSALQSAYDLVTARAEKIIDPALRRSFLERVPINQEIVQEYGNVMRGT